LNLGVEGRMNVPGVANGNWRWRCTEEMLKPSVFERLRDLTTSAGRMSSVKTEIYTQDLALKDEQTWNIRP
jgi:4-alpha-glucanotransferase